MKYARFIDHSAAQDGSDIRATGVVDTDAYDPRPSWGRTDADLLSRIFGNHQAEWTAAGTWFVEVSAEVVDGARLATNGDPLDPSAYAMPSNPPPPKQTTISALAFFKRITISERAAIMASPDPEAKTFVVELELAASENGTVNLLDPDTIAGTNYLEQKTLIGTGRAAQILMP